MCSLPRNQQNSKCCGHKTQWRNINYKCLKHMTISKDPSVSLMVPHVCCAIQYKSNNHGVTSLAHSLAFFNNLENVNRYEKSTLDMKRFIHSTLQPVFQTVFPRYIFIELRQKRKQKRAYIFKQSVQSQSKRNVTQHSNRNIYHQMA